MTTALQSFQEVEAYLNASLFERETEIRDCLAALVSGEHVFMLGPPGVAKSLLVRLLAECFDGSNYFEILMTKFTKKPEVFGPQSIQALKVRDELEYKTDGYLPTCEFAFIDEVFKGNSAVLNCFLTAMNEGIFHNGAKPEKIPLKTMFSASNETPADSSLEALYDRFLVRLYVEPLRDGQNFLDMILGSQGTVAPTLDLKTIEEAAVEADKVVVPKKIQEIFLDIRDQLNYDQANFSEVYVSDRRWKPIVKFLKAHAWLSGKTELTTTDVLKMKNCLWSEQDQIGRIDDMLHTYLGNVVRKVLGLEKQTNEFHQQLRELPADESEKQDVLKGLIQQMKANIDELEAIKNQTKDKDIEKSCQRALEDLNPLHKLVKKLFMDSI